MFFFLFSLNPLRFGGEGRGGGRRQDMVAKMETLEKFGFVCREGQGNLARSQLFIRKPLQMHLSASIASSSVLMLKVKTCIYTYNRLC